MVYNSLCNKYTVTQTMEANHLLNLKTAQIVLGARLRAKPIDEKTHITFRPIPELRDPLKVFMQNTGADITTIMNTALTQYLVREMQGDVA